MLILICVYTEIMFCKALMRHSQEERDKNNYNKKIYFGSFAKIVVKKFLQPVKTITYHMDCLLIINKV